MKGSSPGVTMWRTEPLTAHTSALAVSTALNGTEVQPRDPRPGFCSFHFVITNFGSGPFSDLDLDPTSVSVILTFKSSVESKWVMTDCLCSYLFLVKITSRVIEPLP